MQVSFPEEAVAFWVLDELSRIPLAERSDFFLNES